MGSDRSLKYQGNKGLEYYRAYPRDFFEGVVGMSGNLRGFYRLMIDLIYMHDGFLLQDFQHISGHTGYGPTQCKRMSKTLVEMGKLDIWPENREYFTNKRAVSELNTARKFQENQRNKALNRWKINGLGDEAACDPALPEGMLPQDHDTTIPQESPSDSGETDFAAIPEGGKKQPQFFDDFWAAYPHRGGAKRGKATAQGEFESAVKRGVDPQAIIDAAKEFQRDKKAIDGFAPDPTKWLEKSGWADEIEIGQKPAASVGTAEGQGIRLRYLERTANAMEKSGGGWVIGSRFVDNRDLREIYALGLAPEKLGRADGG